MGGIYDKKKPERLIGFLTYDGLQFAFEFDNEKFYMNLYPQSTQIQEKYGSFIDFKKNQNNEEKRHEWISNIDVIGRSSSGYQVIFNVEENPIKYHGFLTLKLNWYCLSRSSRGDVSYKGFKLIGSDTCISLDNHSYVPMHVRCPDSNSSNTLRLECSTLVEKIRKP